MLLISALHAVVPIGTTCAGNEIVFDLDSLEIRPLPEIAGLNFGNTILSLQADTATYDSRLRKVHITGRVVMKLDQEGISSCTIALGSLKARQGTLSFTPRFQILTDKDGRFSLQVRIARDDVLVLSWTGELYRIYSIGNLIQ